MEVESIHANEILSCLWNKNAPEKCRIGLADVLVYERGRPARWYFTGKTGEISKKRAVDIEVISSRWKRVAAQADSEFIAIMRQEGGMLKILGDDAWANFCSLEGATNDSVQSVHCFVKGPNAAIYRNSFELRDKLGRFVTSTLSYSYSANSYETESVCVVDESKCEFVESRATAIKNIMDLATHTVIRYVEMMLNIKVLKLSIDYVIDTKSQLWMLWTSEAAIVRCSSLADINIPSFLTTNAGDQLGRMSWAGNKYADGVQEKMHRDRSISPETQRDAKLSTITAGVNWSKTLVKTERDTSPSKVNAAQANILVSSASHVIDVAADAAGLKRNHEHIRKKVTDIVGSKHVVEAAEPMYGESKFPDAFKCKGDFCHLHSKPGGYLQTEKGTAVHLEDKIFTEKELTTLRKDKRFASMMIFGSDGPALAAITMKSILLARRERRSSSGNKLTDEIDWQDYPITPRQKHGLKTHLDKLRASGALGSLDSDDVNVDEQSLSSVEKRAEQHAYAVDANLRKDKKHIDDFTKQVANYYEQTRVCGTCFNIYTLLDWARKTLGTDDAHGAGLEALQQSTTQGLPLRHSHSMSVMKQPPSSPDMSSQMSKTSDMRASSPSRSPSRGKRPKNSKEKSTWKSYSDGEKKNPVSVKGDNFVVMDQYLRGNGKEVNEKMAKKKADIARRRVGEMAISLDGGSSIGSLNDQGSTANMYRGKVLLAYEDSPASYEAKSILEDAFFDVYIAKDGRHAINCFNDNHGDFDCILAQRELPLGNAFDVVKAVRSFERDQRKQASAKAAMQGRGVEKMPKRHPVICYTDATSPEDLRVYMQSDMDGCVSYPVNRASLLNTIRAAIPHHLALLAEPEVIPDPHAPQVFKVGNLGLLVGAQDSATQAFETLPIKATVNNDDCVNGVVQIDADTRLPYMVMDAAKFAKVAVREQKPFFNLIVCHDLFDTAEKMKIFFRPIVQKYLGMQILLWNYPGQAYTEYRDEQLLNNEYHASCLNELLGQIGDKGTKDFDTSRPFYIMGYGHGTSIATFYSAYFHVPNLRGLINVNGWAYVDSYLAGVMHDCVNIFQYSPQGRPDLPVYFFSRFLFSKEYLAKVSVPLALNVYTAVHNPISLKGRVNLCKGVLQSVDVRPLLQDIDCPMICIQSTQDSFSRPLHMESFVKNRAGEAKSIYQALQEPNKSCVIWMKAGHEVFQENKKPLRILFEQILTGFHETRDIEFPSILEVDKTLVDQGKVLSNPPNARKSTIEDNFIDVFLGNMNKVTAPENMPAGGMGGKTRAIGSPNSRSESPDRGRSISPGKTTVGLSGPNSMSFSATDPAAWATYSQTISDSQILGKLPGNKRKGTKGGKGEAFRSFDPNTSAFEREDSVVYAQHSKELQNMKGGNPSDYAEVKEYMGWRLKRNKKRLQRLQGAARIIQGGFRAYLARMFVRGIRRRKAASMIQRAFRGWIGRCDFLDQARRIWATQVIQRAWRGYLSRKWYFYVRLRIASAANIQRVFRGHRSRLRVAKIKIIRYKAACTIQALLRRNKARKDAWKKRQQRNAAILIERCYRGRLGRRKAMSERDKYIFSRSQSQGIEFGRQMLLEHKLHATRLQSDVSLLTQEKVSSEEQVEALLEEISSFEEGVRTLEKEMHQLSKVEAEAAAFMDEESKFELREQKMRLDKEFGDMLAKIGNRKDMLNDLERALGSIDKARQGKEEELRTLERKLVVLLEEQQNELNAIKRKQDVRGAMLAASHDEIRRLTQVAPGSNSGAIADATTAMVTHGGGGGGGGGGGPSLQEKRQAAQLMQSTETLMKFGFMSMSMTYFSSLNMIKALRTVSAQDTVMAALADVHAQRAVGFDATAGSGGHDGDGKFLPALKGGQLPGDQSLKVSAWSVEDVANWLQTLSLGQYVEAFTDAAVDGEFLYDLNDDDLKNTLGIEHRLHRKKILNCVHRLKIAEAQSDSRINQLLRETGGLEAPVVADDEPANKFEAQFADRKNVDGPKLSLDELFSLVRHSKFGTIKETLEYLPNKKFDSTLVQSNYVVDYGTVYVAGYEKLSFHINKCDDKGNTMLSMACQNGNQKIAKFLVLKGANPNHQNKHGQSAGHFCISYKFFELGQWLFENGHLDTLENKYGLTPYDGLNNEGETDD